MVVRERDLRLQIMLDDAELEVVEEWRFATHMPSRASAVRELIRRGLSAEGFKLAKVGDTSQIYGVVSPPKQGKK